MGHWLLRQHHRGAWTGATVHRGLGISTGTPSCFANLRGLPLWGIWAGGTAVSGGPRGVRAGPWAGDPLTAHLSQLACALGTGLIVQGEHLAIHHLPSLVVAISAHGAALPIGVERVGAGDGAVHGGAGHRAQQADAAQTRVQHRREGLVVVEDSACVGTACRTVWAALSWDPNRVRARVHTVRPLTAHRTVCLADA